MRTEQQNNAVNTNTSLLSNNVALPLVAAPLNEQTEKRKEKTALTTKQTQTLLINATLHTILYYTTLQINPFLSFIPIITFLITTPKLLKEKKTT